MLSRRLPDQLQIVIEERQPIALLYLEKLYMVDADGVVIGRIPAGETLDFPVISGITLNEWRNRPHVCRRLLQKATSLLQIWNERGQKWPEKIAQVELDEACGVTLYTTGRGWELQLGLDNYRERLGRWRQVIQALGEKATAVKYFDCAGEASVVAGLR
jgi:cell division protein FtsQ